MDWQTEQQQLYKQRKAEQERIRQQEAIEAAQRLADGLRLLDEQRAARQLEAVRKLQLEAIIKKQGSPIEASFYEEWCKQYPAIELKRQYPIGKYRVDFAHEETKTVIELDGYTYHSKKKDRNKDYSRQHEIEDQGWLFVRFTGSQIFTDVASCVQIARKRILQRGQ